MKTFKVGDRVKLIEENIRNVNQGLLPNWYSKDIFTIEKVIDREFDLFGYTIVKLKEQLPNSVDFCVTSYYLKIAINEQRKLKLNKLNGI